MCDRAPPLYVQVQKLATNVLPVIALVLVYVATQIAAKLKVRAAAALWHASGSHSFSCVLRAH